MFTIAAFLAIVLIGWGVTKKQPSDSDDVADNIKHTRQDLRLIAYILFAILVALGVIADRI